jgi:quercetin dioxygenase-like cupin family protein
MHIDWTKVPAEQLTPFITRRCVHQPGMTVARFQLKKGATVPEHQHINAQITNVLSGVLRFDMEGKSMRVCGGESLTIQPEIPHAAFAEEDCDILDIFIPERADWIANDDAYLRSQAAASKP